MKPEEIYGIYVLENKTFYYLESGPQSVPHPLNKIERTLIARDIITYLPSKADIKDTKTKKMSLAEATEKGAKIEILYLNNHIKTVAQAAPALPKIKWGAK